MLQALLPLMRARAVLRQASFVGKRSVRYDGQGGVREIEAAGYSRDGGGGGGGFFGGGGGGGGGGGWGGG